MNKQAILNGMSEEEFYKLYPTKEAYMMAKGGMVLPEAFPQQPTQAQFFNFGPHATAPINFYRDGGFSIPEAFPQQPTQSEFFDFGRIPTGPVGFYQGGGYIIDSVDPEERIADYKQRGWTNANMDMINRGYTTPADTINQKWFQHPTNPNNIVGIRIPPPVVHKDSVKKPVYPRRTDYSAGSKGPAYTMEQGGMPCLECGGQHMQNGGEQFGGMVDNDMDYFKSGGSNWIQKATKNMRTDKPCTGSKFGGPSCPPGSRRYNLAKTFRAMAKKQFGGDTAEMFVDDADYGKGITNTFLTAIRNNLGTNLADEAAEEVDMAYAQMGMSMQDYGYNPNMMYNQMYANKADYLKNQGQQAMGNFFDTSMNLESTKNPYMQYDVVPKAQTGAFMNASTNQANVGQGSYSDNSGTHWSDADYRDEYARRNAIPMPNNQSYYPQQGYGQGHSAFPMNYTPGYRWRTQGLDMPIPYNPNNTYLTHFDAKKRFFGPGARRIQMDFRTYGQPGSKGNNFNFNDREWQKSITQENYKKPAKRMSYEAEVEALRQEALLRGQTPAPAFPAPGASAPTQGFPYNTLAPDAYPRTSKQDQLEAFMNKTLPSRSRPVLGENPDEYQEGGDYQDWSVIGKYKQGYDPEAAANWMLAGTAGLTSMFNAKDRMNTEKQMMKNTLADNQFSAMPADMIQNKGRWNWTGMSTGMMDPGNMQVIQQPGYSQVGGEIEMDEDEIEEFLRNGGQIQYID
jgi:hypothetical protein